MIVIVKIQIPDFIRLSLSLITWSPVPNWKYHLRIVFLECLLPNMTQPFRCFTCLINLEFLCFSIAILFCSCHKSYNFDYLRLSYLRIKYWIQLPGHNLPRSRSFKYFLASTLFSLHSQHPIHPQQEGLPLMKQPTHYCLNLMAERQSQSWKCENGWHLKVKLLIRKVN